MSHPYLPLYVDDYEAATAHLTAEEDGIYGRMLRLCWRTPGCSLPNDHGWIARKVRLSAKDYERIGRPLVEEFFKLQRGRLVQKRLKAEYDDISRKKSVRVKAGKAGGVAKALKTQDKASSKGTVLPGDTRASPEPYPEPDTPTDVGVTRARKSGFDEWWGEYPDAVAQPVARKAYAAACRAIGGSDPDAVLMAGLRRSLASARWADPTYTRPNPAKWLSEERWNDRDPVPLLARELATKAPAPIDEAFVKSRLALLKDSAPCPS
jgi:uncharacterized protein YdaU (DUF1376 family)